MTTTRALCWLALGALGGTAMAATWCARRRAQDRQAADRLRRHLAEVAVAPRPHLVLVPSAAVHQVEHPMDPFEVGGGGPDTPGAPRWHPSDPASLRPA